FVFRYVRYSRSKKPTQCARPYVQSHETHPASPHTATRDFPVSRSAPVHSIGSNKTGRGHQASNWSLLYTESNQHPTPSITISGVTLTIVIQVNHAGRHEPARPGAPLLWASPALPSWPFARYSKAFDELCIWSSYERK